MSCTVAITVSFEQSQYGIRENDGLAQLVLVLSNSSLANITVLIANPQKDGE